MFGFWKQKRGKEAILSALKVLLVGRPADRNVVSNAPEEEIAPLAREVANGSNPYLAALQLVQGHILQALERCSPEERVILLDCISKRNFSSPPNLFELIAHVNHCLLVLESDDKPLVPSGTSAAFLSTLSKWFSKEKELQNVIVNYFGKNTQHYRVRLNKIRENNEKRGKFSGV